MKIATKTVYYCSEGNQRTWRVIVWILKRFANTRDRCRVWGGGRGWAIYDKYILLSYHILMIVVNTCMYKSRIHFTSHITTGPYITYIFPLCTIKTILYVGKCECN
ncbi:hypothetical protein BDB00DRAFT_116011 [Zychaea mexicana]|uniref:uncharacterized protein n=1 Tax=Zychaea mexicana TaxID=64656 RepID=UPI0022FF0C25|nr:uncharacterized protein BDB00DRAFT_116011 [Zychaea mexicana]KAI9484707.1 hypothetical protein BDB00DRAFT_116011 [Zychaea mexicana]